MKPILVDSFTATTCVGPGNRSLLDAIKHDHSGLSPCSFDRVRIGTWVGKVDSIDERENTLPPGYELFECRNNRLAWYSLQQDGFYNRLMEVIKIFGSKRIGLFLGTSTSGIYETELAFRTIHPETGKFSTKLNYFETHSIHSLCKFIRQVCKIEGPNFIVSTACSSSSKVFATAQRFIETGLIDAALVGGVDSLCLTTLYGFNSLQLTSNLPCRPFNKNRNGISIGEAAAFAILCKYPESTNEINKSFALMGYGESSDAYHMSSPHPDGLGAQLAMCAAIKSAGIGITDIDYINLHGTATQANDFAEGAGVKAVFGHRTPCSSTKGITGHTLGAAGAVEAVISLLALQNGIIPGSPNTITLDPDIRINYQLTASNASPKCILSNSFGFGGSNCSLIFGLRSQT